MTENLSKGYLQPNQASLALDTDVLSRINKLTRREFSADELYVFPIVLCDNDIDRDFERFTVSALHTLAEMFVGKTGISDHDMKAGSQTARIYHCEVCSQPERYTQTGEEYHYLKAYAYLPRSEQNEQFILELDSGIKKEVSVGCSVSSITCSICGSDRHNNGCTHVKSRHYGKKLCHAILDNPSDAYEWSFVAVPAQPAAGVAKSFPLSPQRKDFSSMDTPAIITKALRDADGDLTLSASQASLLSDYISELELLANDGREYHKSLRKEVIRLSTLADSGIEASLLENLCSRMKVFELEAFKAAFEKKANSITPAVPQLISRKDISAQPQNTSFKI